MKIEGNKTNVAVIFGGKSVEHDISIITGVQTLNNLDKQKYNIFPIYITKEGKWLYSQNFFDIKVFTKDIKFLSDVKPVSLSTFNSSLFIVKAKKQKLLTKLDFAFLATHGAMGENGSLQGYLDMCNLPYTSCGVESSAVCMNKALTKLVLEKNDVESTKYTVLTPDDYKKGFVHILKQINNLVFPLVVKPSNLGSSIGINLCKNKTSLKNAISFAFLFDNLVIVEEAVQNLREFNIAVMGNSVKQELSDIEEVFSKNEFLTFESKYLNNSNSKGMEATDRKIPALITEETKEIIQTSALKIFKYSTTENNL